MTPHRFRRHRAGLQALLVAALAGPLQAGAADPPVPAVPVPASAAKSIPTAVATDPAPPWTLATLPDDAVPFHGMLNLDGGGMGPGYMAYPMVPGFGLIGLLVGVATHAAVVGGMRSGQESKAQTAADQVLDPYRVSLAGFRLNDLEQRALSLTPIGRSARLRPAVEAGSDDVVVEAVPAFSMTPDAEALVLDEVVVVRTVGVAGAGAPQTLRIVSAPRVDPDLQGAWNENGGEALKSTAAALMAESLDLALSPSLRAQRSTPGGETDIKPFKTVRYMLGGLEKMERAQLLGETCQRLLLRSLRGVWMAVPHPVGAVLPPGCPAPAAIPLRASPASAAAPAAPPPSAQGASPAVPVLPASSVSS